MQTVAATDASRVFADVHKAIVTAFPDLLGDVPLAPEDPEEPRRAPGDICDAIAARVAAIGHQVMATVTKAKRAVEEAVDLLARWMTEGTIVRVLGAGRARLAAALPANRLAHGGARVHVQGDIIPLPHMIKGGGIIACSASGKTPSVLHALAGARQETKNIRIIGLAAQDALEFAKYCDIFIGIQPETDSHLNPLRALADSEEYVISELLDAMVAAAGKRAGFTDIWWKLGHENLGTETGPYDYKTAK